MIISSYLIGKKRTIKIFHINNHPLPNYSSLMKFKNKQIIIKKISCMYIRSHNRIPRHPIFSDRRRRVGKEC